MSGRLAGKVAVVAGAGASSDGVIGNEGTGWDVAHAAVFLASDESRWITGVALPVDAGFLVMSPTTQVRLAQQKF